MMFRCVSCGNLFEDGEQAVWEERHGLDTPPYEKWSGCPVCKGDYEEVYQCKECGEWHTEDEIYDGWCENCLRESINYDTFFEYCEANKDANYLDIFVMSEFFAMECPYDVSPEFHQLMIDTYQFRAERAKNNAILDGFIDACVRFIMDDEGDEGRENYADWMNNRKVVK